MRFRATLLAAIVAATAFAQGVVDVHSHLIPTEFVSALENEGRLMDEGFPLPKYDVKSHLKWMNEAGVETSILTLAAPQPSSAVVVRKTNETAARIKHAFDTEDIDVPELCEEDSIVQIDSKWCYVKI